jgi:hypothetical protein
VFIIRVLVERLLEIKEEDKDDLSKYWFYTRKRIWSFKYC